MKFLAFVFAGTLGFAEVSDSKDEFDLVKYMAWYYDEVDPCGMVFDPGYNLIAHGHYNRTILDFCYALCRIDKPAAIKQGCTMGQHHDLDRDFGVNYGGIPFFVKEKRYDSTYSPTQCARDCWANPYCLGWQYGLAYDEENNKTDFSHRMCGHMTADDLDQINVMPEDDDQGFTPIECGQYKAENIQFSSMLDLMHSEDPKKRSAARFGMLAGGYSVSPCTFLVSPLTLGTAEVVFPEDTLSYFDFLSTYELQYTWSVSHPPFDLCPQVMTTTDSAEEQSQCILKCRAYGPGKLDHSCTFLKDLKGSRIVMTSAIPRAKKEALFSPSHMSVAECRLSCLKSASADGCYYWQYGLYKDDYSIHPDLTHTICTHFTKAQYDAHESPSKSDAISYDNDFGSTRMVCRANNQSNIYLNFDRAFQDESSRYDSRVSGFSHSCHNRCEGYYLSGYLVDLYSSQNQCQMVFGELASVSHPDRDRLSVCQARCLIDGVDKVGEGCYNAAEANHYGQFSKSGFFKLPNEIEHNKDYSPLDCAQDCYKNRTCAYWQYGFAYNNSLQTVDPDRRVCGRLSYEELAGMPTSSPLDLNQEICGLPYVNQLKCQKGLTSFYENIQDLWASPNEEIRSYARISGFVGGDLCDYIDGKASPEKMQVSGGLSLFEFISNYYSQRNPCALVVSTTDGDAAKQKACMLKCLAHGIDGIKDECVIASPNTTQSRIFTRGIVGLSEEKDAIVSFTTPAECVLTCLEAGESRCFYWQYGPYRDPNNPTINTKPDLDITLTMCTIINKDRYKEFAHADSKQQYDFPGGSSRYICPEGSWSNIVQDLDHAFKVPNYQYDARISGYFGGDQKCADL